MGTTQQKLAYLSNAVSGIKSAIESRGVVVGDAPLAQYSSKIEEIPSDNIASVVDKSVTGITADMLKGATEIGDYTFYGCTDLTTVHIPATVTSIGNYAFYGCTSLATIYFHGTSAQWSSITKGTNWDGNTGDYTVVCWSQGLTYESNGDGTCSVSGIGTCTDTDVGIPDVSPDGDSVTSIGDNAFLENTSLTSVAIPDSVTNIGEGAFMHCSSLSSITIPDSVTGIGAAAFSGCSTLTSIIIPDSVTSIENNTFYGCSGLTAITVPDSVTKIYYGAFYGCTGLTSVTIGDGVTSIGSGAFNGCTGLNSATILRATPPRLYSVDSFNGAYPICVPAGSVETYKAATTWSELASRIQAIQ